MGEFLKETPKNEGTKNQLSGGSLKSPPAEKPPTLADMGISEKESARAQRLAVMPEEEFRGCRVQRHL
jgi:hypothetical protein